MPESVSHRSESSPFNLLLPGPVHTVKVVGFEGSDVLVEAASGVLGRISSGEVAMRRVGHPSEVFEVGQLVEAEEIGTWRGELHLSARACENPRLRAFLTGTLPGEVVSGAVKSVHNFGVLVHLDGEPEGFCTGFIRVIDLTWSHIGHPSEAVEAGQLVTGKVIVSETRTGQVTISLKALQPDPLIAFAAQEGAVLQGRVTKVVPLGMIVRVADAVEGLLHRTELPPEAVDGEHILVREGDVLSVRVAKVDLQRHRVQLSRPD